MILRYTVLLALLPLAVRAQEPTPDWVAVGTGVGDAAVLAVADEFSTDPAGVVAVGHFRGEVVFGPTAATAPDTTTAAFVVAFGPDGAVRWLRGARAPGGRVVATGVAVVGNGFGTGASYEIVVTGYATAPARFDAGSGGSTYFSYFYVSPGASDGFVARYSAGGDLRRVHGIRGSGGVWPAAMVTANGSALIVGAFDGTVSWDEGETVTRTAVGGTDGFAARYRADGSLERIETVGGPADDALTDVVAIPFAGAWASGTFRDRVVVADDTLDNRGGTDALAVRFGVDGAPIKAVHVGGGGDETGDGIHNLGDGPFGAVVVGGTFTDSLSVGTDTLRSRGATDLFLVEISTETLAVVGAVQLGGPGADHLHDVASVGAFYGDLSGDAYLVAASAGDGIVLPPFTGGGSPLPPELNGYGGADAAAVTLIPNTGWGASGGYAATLVGGPSTDRALAATGVGCFGGGICQTAAIGGLLEGSAQFGALVVTGGSDADAFVAHYPETALTPFFAASEEAPSPSASLTVGPNPTRGAATAALMLAAPADVTVTLYDALGRRVASLHRGPLAAGPSRWALPGGLAPGVYVVRATGGVQASATLVVAR